MTREIVLRVYEENIIDKPRIAVFRVFSQKYKELARNLKNEEKAVKGENIHD